MGSKMVSTRVIQVVKPHMPLMRLPDRRDSPKPSVAEALRWAGTPSHTAVISWHSKGSKSPELLMYHSPPDTTGIIKTLPQTYRRKHYLKRKWNVSNVEVQNNDCGGCLSSDKRIIFTKRTSKITHEKLYIKHF